MKARIYIRAFVVPGNDHDPPRHPINLLPKARIYICTFGPAHISSVKRVPTCRGRAFLKIYNSQKKI